MGVKRSQTAANKKHRIYVRDKGLCHYCGILCNQFPNKGTQSRDATLDHVQTRMAGGGNADENLVLACHDCNNGRSCIPYSLFKSERLWMNCMETRRKTLARLFAIGAQPVNDVKPVWLLEMYNDNGEDVMVQNWGLFATAQGVHKYMLEKFPEAVHNVDDDLDHIGFHFPDGHVMEDVSFVANAWDLQ